MNRRAFLTRLAGMTAAAIVAPEAVLDSMKPVASKPCVPVPCLPVGIIRDNDILATNDFQMFHENFEGITNTGLVAGRHEVRLTA
jgi:hypothetical protein